MNSVNLIGRTTKNVELKYTTSNKEYVKFTLAVKREYKTNGEYETDWINCIAWGHSAIFMSNYVLKGNLIGIKGRIQTGSYNDKDGKTIYTTDVVCESVQSLEPRKEVEQHVQYPEKDERQREYDRRQNTPSIDVSEDDLPFR